MPKIAAIDVGANRIWMMVSRLDADGQLETLENLRLFGGSELMLEKHNLEKRKTLFQVVFGVKLEVMTL